MSITMGWTIGGQTLEPPHELRTYAIGRNSPNQAVLNIKEFTGERSTRKWEVMITFERKKIHLGCFRSEIDAAKAYDRAARKYHGEFACLNFPESGSG